MLQVTCEREESLENSQEEADTKVFLCAQHAAKPVCIHTVDSDIGIYALYFDDLIENSIYVSIGVKIVNASSISGKLLNL